MFDSSAHLALERALLEALHDEYKACATYRQIIRKFGPIRPFVNILASEQRHIRALTRLFHKYGIAVPENDWETRVTVPNSVREACQEGVQGEIENAEMYQRLLQMTRGYRDVQNVFLNLQRASQENHLRAFQRCAERQRDERSPSQIQATTHYGFPSAMGGARSEPRTIEHRHPERCGAGRRHRYRGGRGYQEYGHQKHGCTHIKSANLSWP